MSNLIPSYGVSANTQREINRKMMRTPIKIRRLVLRETGRYQSMFRRPNVLCASSQHTFDTVMDNLASTYHQSQGMVNISPGEIASYSHELMAQASPEKSIIENGWDTNRLRFLLEIEYEVEMGNKIVETFLGYSEHTGVVHHNNQSMYKSGMAIDDNMVLRITNMNRRKMTYSTSPLSGPGVSSVVNNRHTILSAPGVNSLDFGAQRINSTVTMRPYDVVAAGAAVQTVSQAMAENTEVLFATSTVQNNVGVSTAQLHSSPAHYLTDLINTSVNSINVNTNEHRHTYERDYTNYGSDDDDVFNSIRKIMQPEVSKAISNYEFINVIADLTMNNGGMGAHPTNSQVTPLFTLKMLSEIDKSFNSGTSRDPRIDCQILDSGAKMAADFTSNTSFTSNWNGTNIEDKMAYFLASTLPALLLENGIAFASITADNLFGSFNTQVFVTSALSLDGEVLPQASAALGSQIRSIIIPYISMNQEVAFSFNGRFSVIDDCNFEIMVGGSPKTRFVIPGICSSIYSPMITSDKNLLNINGHGCGLIVGGLKDIRNEIRYGENHSLYQNQPPSATFSHGGFNQQQSNQGQFNSPINNNANSFGDFKF